MYIPFLHDPGTVGREDRLVRAGVALSLGLLGVFALLTGTGLALIPVAFLVAASYFATSSVTGRDPLYTVTGIDTRSDAELGIATESGSLQDLRPGTEARELLNR